MLIICARNEYVFMVSACENVKSRALCERLDARDLRNIFIYASPTIDAPRSMIARAYMRGVSG